MRRVVGRVERGVGRDGRRSRWLGECGDGEGVIVGGEREVVVRRRVLVKRRWRVRRWVVRFW